MTLFAALTAKDGDSSSSSAQSSSSSSPPEAIQLHSNRVIDFLNATTVHLLTPSSSSNSNKSSGGEESTIKEELLSNDTTATNKGHSKYFSALSYQAIQTLQEDGPTSSATTGTTAGTATTAAAQMRHLRPDLGVWDCRINSQNTEASALLLKRVVMNKKTTQLCAARESNSSGEEKKADETAVEAVAAEDSSGIFHPIVMAVDLSDPTGVQPVVEHMRSVILNVYESEDKAANNPPQVQCTTSVKALQNSPFGKTLIQQEIKGSGSEQQRIALILAVIVPPTITAATSSAAEEYKERQARALLLYHLHKFSLEVDCTLVFVSEKGKGSPSALLGGKEGEETEAKELAEENDPLLGRNTTMSIEELGRVVRRVAVGLSPVELSEQKSNNDDQKEEPKEESKEGTNTLPPSIHVPGSHDAELIHGAYLRNASCEGRWDATKDDLNVALPPSSSSRNALGDRKEETTTTGGGGDEEWLSQLASSIGLSPDAATTAPGEALTPVVDKAEQRKKSAVKARPKRSTVARNKDSKPKDEKEVMNFFDNLLKK